jgi:small subunit ribosomal protein S27e
MPLARDLLNPSIEEEKRKNKLKRLVQSPNSFFMDVKCPQCQTVNTIFSHIQTVVTCSNCGFLLAVPRGGKTKLAVGTAWRRKGN